MTCGSFEPVRSFKGVRIFRSTPFSFGGATLRSAIGTSALCTSPPDT